MTKLFDEAVATVQGLPPEAQDQIAHMVMLYAELPVAQLTPGEEVDLAEGDTEMARGDFATDEHMKAIWAKYAL